VENELDDDFDSMLVVVLIAFGCMLTNKQVWGTNVGQRGIKIGVFGVKLDEFPRGNPKTRLRVLVQLAWRAHGTRWRVATFLNDSFDVLNCCRVKDDNGRLMISQIYVDDIVFGGMSNKMVQHFIQQMQSEFEMSLVVELTYFLGLQVKQMKDTIFIS
jgi:hypothetical protein